MEFASVKKYKFLIRHAFIGKAAEYIRKSPDLTGMIFDNEVMPYDVDLICAALGFFGFKSKPVEDGIEAYFHGDDVPWGFGSIPSIDLFEVFCKAVTRAVEPGSFIEMEINGDIVRYVFLYDVVEKWSVPHVLFEKKEAI